jgi:hypothetical protein
MGHERVQDATYINQSINQSMSTMQGVLYYHHQLSNRSSA